MADNNKYRSFASVSTLREEYKWTDQDTEALILWRTANHELFNGRRNAARRGFEEFVKEHGLVGKVQPIKVKRKWENLKQKYKELLAHRSGIITEGGEATVTSWKWFKLMDEGLHYASGHYPSGWISPITVDSSSQDVVLVCPPSPREPQQEEAETPPKKRREPEWVRLLKQVIQRDEEREKVNLEREERREREALEREERKERERLDREEKMERERLDREEKMERERLDREEKMERERMDREERRERERMDREEKREREWREWLERREKDIAERDERRQKDMMSLLEKIFKK